MNRNVHSQSLCLPDSVTLTILEYFLGGTIFVLFKAEPF